MRMRRRPKLRPVLWDGVVVIVIVMAVLGSGRAFWGSEGRGEEAIVLIDGEEADCFEVKEGTEREYLANGYRLIVKVTESGVRVAEADCPTQDCVHTGEITRSGQSIVCLPGRFILRLAGGAEEPSDIDAVIG